MKTYYCDSKCDSGIRSILVRRSGAQRRFRHRRTVMTQRFSSLRLVPMNAVPSNFRLEHKTEHNNCRMRGPESD
jgi:hypothetical protein